MTTASTIFAALLFDYITRESLKGVTLEECIISQRSSPPATLIPRRGLFVSWLHSAADAFLRNKQMRRTLPKEDPHVRRLPTFTPEELKEYDDRVFDGWNYVKPQRLDPELKIIYEEADLCLMLGMIVEWLKTADIPVPMTPEGLQFLFEQERDYSIPLSYFRRFEWRD